MGALLNRRRYMSVQKQEKVLFEMYNQYFDGTVNSVVDTELKLWDGTHNSWKMEVVYQKLTGQADLTTLLTVRPDYSPYSGIRFRKVDSDGIQLTISDTWSVIANEGGFNIYVHTAYGNSLGKTESLDYDSLIIIRNGNTLFIDFNGYTAEVLITDPKTNNMNLLIGCDYKGTNNRTQRYYTGTVQKFVVTELPATYDAGKNI